MDLYLTKIKRERISFGNRDVPSDLVSLCILYFEVDDGALAVESRSRLQLCANYQYVFETVVIGEAATLSEKWDDGAKLMIYSHGDIVLTRRSALQLCSCSEYLFIETLGDIVMETDSRIGAASVGASIFIKCRKLIMDPSATIKANI